MKLEQLRNSARTQWDALYRGQNAHILIGTATCGRAAGALATADVFRKTCAEKGSAAVITEVGCMGLCSFEPLVTIVKPGSFTVCYHHVTPQLVPQLVEGYVLGDDPCLDLALGTVDGGDGIPISIPELSRFEHERRLILRNCGFNNPEDINHYIASGGYAGLETALKMEPDEVIRAVKDSGLRGRGGAGFPTGMKWELCCKAKGAQKYVICNADEGDPGAFMDRVLLESDSHQVIEGMAIAAYAIGASRGFIYVRAEYPLAVARIKMALSQAEKMGLLGNGIMGNHFHFSIEIAQGAGAFVSGEETALMRAIEGKRSSPDSRPPYPAERGLWNMPTLINNVKTFAFIPLIIGKGSQWFSGIGTGSSKGTAVFALAGKMLNTGLAEVAMGTTLRKLVFDIGGGMKDGKKFKAVQIGGPSGGCLPETMLDTPVDFDSLRQAGAIMGSGGLIVMDEDDCMVDTARFFLDFIQKESCGKCTPCRLGTWHMHHILENIATGKGSIDDLALLADLGKDVRESSLCGLGRTAPNSALTTMKYFREEYAAHIIEKRCPALVCKELIAYYILPEKCERGCEHCVLACPVEAITANDKGIKVIDQEKCTRCGSCRLVCPGEYSAVIKLSPVSLVPAAPGKAAKKEE